MSKTIDGEPMHFTVAKKKKTATFASKVVSGGALEFLAATLAAQPPVTFVASDGTIRGTGNGWGGWTVVRSADGCSLLLSGNPGTIVILR